jgi:hypothetical protein
VVCKFLPKLGPNASLVEQDTQSAHSLSIKITDHDKGLLR